MEFKSERDLRGLSIDNMDPDFLLKKDIWTQEAFEGVLDVQAAITAALRLAIVTHEFERIERLEDLYDDYNELIAALVDDWPEDMLPLRLQC